MQWLSSFFKFLSSLCKSLEQFFCSHPHWETLDGENADYIPAPVPPDNGAIYAKWECKCTTCGKQTKRYSNIEYGENYDGIGVII